MTPLEFLSSGVKLQSGAMGAIVTASQAVRKGGTIQITGVYGGRYNAFPLGDMFQRNVAIRTGQALVVHIMPHVYYLIADGKVNAGDIIHTSSLLKKQNMVMKYSIQNRKTVLKWF